MKQRDMPGRNRELARLCSGWKPVACPDDVFLLFHTMRIFKWIWLLFLLAPLSAEPFIVAHRGASHDAPENTLAAFELAWEQGADAIEGDFHLTQDGHIVCLHDKDTKRTAGKKLVVGKSSLEELRKALRSD